MNKTVYALATLDTKGEEIAYIARCIESAGVGVTIVDLGTKGAPTIMPDVSREMVARCHPRGEAAVLENTDRGMAVTAMSEALEVFLKREQAAGKIAGAIGIGGGGGSALISPALRALPIGFPKLLVSTLPGGNAAPYMGCCDFTIVHSVVDVSGLNSVSVKVLANAAHAMAGMVRYAPPSVESKPALGMTMFGVTTPCVTAVRKALEAQGYDCLVFHATGTGGQAMEKLVESGMIGGVLDITTTEVADEVGGGTLRAGPNRFDAIINKKIPLVLSVGAMDMINFGAKETVPPQFADRKFHIHNAQVTLMRTSVEDNVNAAKFIARKLNRSTAKVIVLLPEKGVSMLDAEGQAFEDTQARAALFETLEKEIQQTPARQVRRLPFNINDPEFSAALVAAYKEVSKR
jgi:uncharacterized protein (UPF0261 family)